MDVGFHKGVTDKAGGVGLISGKMGQSSFSYRPKKDIIVGRLFFQ